MKALLARRSAMTGYPALSRRAPPWQQPASSTAPAGDAGLRLRPCSSLSSDTLGDERRQPSGRRYDRLPRKPAKPQHETCAGARCAVEAANRAHDDTGALGAGLDSDVRRSVAQIGDEMHALIGDRNVEPTRRATYQRLRQRVALFAIELAHAANVRSEMALLHELGNHRLLQRRRLAIDQIARADKSPQQRARHHGVTDAQTRK